MRKFLLSAAGFCLAVQMVGTPVLAVPLSGGTAQAVAGAHVSPVQLAANRCIRCQNRCYARFKDDLDRYADCKLRCKGSNLCMRLR